MALRNIHDDIITALQNRVPLLTYHLVKFEKPSSLQKATRRTDFTYLTDAPYDVDFDEDGDGSTNGYKAGGIVKIGKVQEAIEARATKMSLTLSAVKLGATAVAQAEIATNIPSTLPAANGNGNGAAGLLTLDFDLFSAGFYVGDTISLTRTSLDFIGNPLAFPKNTNFTGAAPTVLTVQIDRISNDGKSIHVTSLEKEGIVAFTTPLECNIDYVNPEVTTLTAKNIGSLSYESYVNRSVEIYRVFAHPDTGVIIGSPFLYFKGVIAQGTLNEKISGQPTITWSLTSHWGDFVRVQGRLTSDEFHRGLDSAGYSLENTALKPQYASDFGFEHADKSLNVLAKYTGTDSRLKSRRRGGLAGMMGGRKYSTEYFEVERQLDLRLNLEAKHIPVVYGVQKIDSFPAFADIIITPDVTPNQTGSSTAQFDGGFTTMYSANVLCEGPISGLFDVFVDDESLVCKDEADRSVRRMDDPGTVSNDDNVKGVACFGSMEKGDVAGGDFFNIISSQAAGQISHTQYGTFIISGGADPSGLGIQVTMVLPDGSTINPADPAVFDSSGNQIGGYFSQKQDQRGVLHEKSLGPLPQAKNLKLTFHSGKDDQEANKILMNKAAGEGSGSPLFLGQQQYIKLGLDPGTYWGQSHRLLDTAYVVLEDKVSDTDAQLPDISYVVKGKFVNCFNYDGTYRNNLVDDPNSAQHFDNFDLADKVDIEPHYRPGLQYRSTIIDKWFFVDMDAEYDYRFRFKVDNLTISEARGASSLIMTGGMGALGLETGDKVTYINTDNSPISPLINGKEYFVVAAGQSPGLGIGVNQIHLAETKEKALASPAVILPIAATTITSGTHLLEQTFLDEQLINDGIKRFKVRHANNPNQHFFTCTSETFGGGSDINVSNVEYTSEGYIHQQDPNPLAPFPISIKRTVTRGKQIDHTLFSNEFGIDTGAMVNVFGTNVPEALVTLFKDGITAAQAAAITASLGSGNPLTQADFAAVGNSLPTGDSYVYEIDFSGDPSLNIAAAPALARNLIKAIKGTPSAAQAIDLQIKREHKGGTVVNGVLQDGTTVKVSPFTTVSGWPGLAAAYDVSTDKIILNGFNTQLDELFDAVNTDAPGAGQIDNTDPANPVQQENVDTKIHSSNVTATLQFFQVLVQDSTAPDIDTTHADTLDGTTITFKKDNVEDKTVGLAYPSDTETAVSGTNLNIALRNANLLVLTEHLNTTDHGGSSKYSYGGKSYEGSGVPNKSDRRVSINPALQLLDYLRSTTYGKGLSDDLLNIESFRETARACDQQSRVTVLGSHIRPPTHISVGDVYEYRFPETSSKVFFRGTLEEISDTIQYDVAEYNPTTNTTTTVTRSYKQYTFKDVIGKLGRKWYSYTKYHRGEIVWTVEGKALIVDPGTINDPYPKTISQPTTPLPQATISAGYTGGGATGGVVYLTKVSGASNTNSDTELHLDTEVHSGGTGNPIVKKLVGDGRIASGYDLYDSCDVRYWKYLGWEERTQRHATRHQLNQTLDTSAPLFDNVNQMLTQFNGILRYSNGKYELDLKTKAPTTISSLEQITTDRIIGDIKITDKGLSKTYNSVTTGYIDPQNGFNSKNITYYNSDYKKQDKGISRQGQYKAPGITNYFNNRMNIKQMLDESRSGLTATFTGSPETYVLLPGNIIAITYERFNWASKLFRIQSMSPRDDLLVDFTVIEHNDDAYVLEALPSDLVESIYPEGPGFPVVNPITPTGLTAVGTTDGIRLNWNNVVNFSQETHIVEVWRSSNSSFSTSFPTFGTENDVEKAHKTSSVNTTTDDANLDPDLTYYYWIRYRLPSNKGAAGVKQFSGFHPGRNEPGVSATALDNRSYSVDFFGPQTANYDAAGDLLSGSTFTYTATAFNFLDPRFKFTFDGAAEPSFTAPASGSQKTFNITVPSTIFTGVKDIKVEIQEGAAGGTKIEETLTLVAVQQPQTQKTVKLFKKLNNVNVITGITNPAQQTFANPTNGISGWSTTQQDLTQNLDVIFMVERVFTTDGLSPQDAAWSPPVIVARREDGAVGPDGPGTPRMDLTNENHSVTADRFGNVVNSNFPGANTAVAIYEGATNVTNNWTFATPVASNSGLGFSWNGTTKILQITSMSAALTEATVTISASYLGTTLTKTFTITKINAGASGAEGESVNIIFGRFSAANPPPGTPANSASPNNSIGWYDNPPADQGDPLYASRGTKASGATNFVWSTPYRVDGDSVAEVYVYSNVITGNNIPTPPTSSTYNFRTSTLTINDASWNKDPPSLVNDGDQIYVAVGLATGTPRGTPTVTFGAAARYAVKTDGDDAVVYSLNIVPSVIKKTIPATGSATFDFTTLNVSTIKTAGTTVTQSPLPANEVIIKAYLNSATSAHATSSNGNMTLTSSANYGSASSIKFELIKNSVVIDTETVPILEQEQGASGPRTIQGYLYYRKTGPNHAIAPSAPNGNTYTFSTGIVSATFPVSPPDINTGTTPLDNVWQNSPQTTNAAALETVWTVRYYGTESSSGATSIGVSYSTVVKHTNFTGVVTFSSGTQLTDGSVTIDPLTANEVNGTSGVTQTIIDGGNISAGSIRAGNFSGDVTETYTLSFGDQQAGIAGNFTQASTSIFHFTVPAPKDNGVTLNGVSANVARSLFGNMHVVLESSSQYIIRAYTEIFLKSGTVSGAASGTMYRQNFNGYTFVSNTPVSPFAGSALKYLEINGDKMDELNIGGLLYKHGGTGGYSPIVGLEYYPTGALGSNSSERTRVYFYSNNSLSSNNRANLKGTFSPSYMIWENWPSIYNTSLSGTPSIAQVSMRARIGGIYKASGPGVCVMPINFRLPKRVHTSPVELTAKTTIVHHTTNSVHTSTNAAGGSSISLAVRFVGGTFGYSV